MHSELRRRYHDAPELVLAGSSSMELGGDGVRYLGRISEEDKLDGLTGAMAVVVPSRFESLSLLALEAFAQGTPVLATHHSEVLAGQVARSGAGLTYRDLPSFVEGVQKLGAQRARYSKKGLSYAKKHSWAKVVDAYQDEMARIVKEARR
jgi:glycosyltransferase involved in cell wall biosynthesis